ncbi:MAG: Gfo/Idh/MocA family oxidoreductase [Armatimonadetes bacterium]|nr:Gfo/Idh/MocA family oxidoreductase [Armatimonadota bacterium]
MKSKETLSRRSFLQAATASTLVFALHAEAAEEEKPQEAEPAQPVGPPVACGVIGCGPRGRELMQALSRVPGAPVKMICDNYPGAFTLAKKAAPEATTVPDYKQLLDNKEIAAVFVATPSHLHRQIVLDALQAGKHVYCEAPLAHTVDEATAIAKAAKDAKTTFQAGLQGRCNPLYQHALKFLGIGALGQLAQMRAQWHRKESWRRVGANAERERALNWRLYKASSAGLMGEVGIHQVDTISWGLKAIPEAVQGFGGIYQWKDDREVADTVQCVFDYPGGVRLLYDATLANSFGGAYELYMGSDGAIYLMQERGWMIKESDAPQIGWEVYAYKEQVGVPGATQTGIGLIADATKLLAQGREPKDVGPGGEKGKDALYYAVESFIQCAREGKPSECGAAEGLQATVVAIKANEAITTGQKITFQPEWFAL